jgi:hypothetical protein
MKSKTIIIAIAFIIFGFITVLMSSKSYQCLIAGVCGIITGFLSNMDWK